MKILRWELGGKKQRNLKNNVLTELGGFSIPTSQRLGKRNWKYMLNIQAYQQIWYYDIEDLSKERENSCSSEQVERRKQNVWKIQRSKVVEFAKNVQSVCGGNGARESPEQGLWFWYMRKIQSTQSGPWDLAMNPLPGCFQTSMDSCHSGMVAFPMTCLSPLKTQMLSKSLES